MKKYIMIIVLTIFSFGVFAQNNVEQVIYDPITQEEDFLFLSPIALGYNMYRIHIILAQGGLQEISSYNYIQLISSLKDMASYNILDMLEFEIDKKSVMDSYITRLDILLLKADFSIANLKEEMSLLDYDSTYCLSQKKLADQQYLDTIKYDYQQVILQDSLNDSKKYAQCASDSRIESNAKKVLLDKITVYRSVLKAKYDYIFPRKDEIVDNYDLIKTDVLQRLLIIKRMLEQYDL